MASGRGERANVPPCPSNVFSMMLVGTIWFARPMIGPQAILLVSGAHAQTAADYPASFADLLVEPSLERVAIRHTASSDVRWRGNGRDVLVLIYRESD